MTGHALSPDKDQKTGSFWSRLSPLYKKRGLQGAAAYLVLAGAVSLWLFARAEGTVAAWNARIPQAVISLDTAAPYISERPGPHALPGPPAPEIEVLPPLPSGNGARIALILTDLGLSESVTTHALRTLPQEVAFSFSPYSRQLSSWLNQARQEGRETFLLLPMEPLSYPKDDPGPRALLSRKSEVENAESLQGLLKLGRTTGVMNFMGSRFLADGRNMRPMLAQIRRQNLVFIETPAMAGLQSAAGFAEEANVPYLSADILIDAQEGESAVRQQLFQLEQAAEEKGAALGIISPYPVTIALLPAWIDSLKRRGFAVTVPTELLKRTPLPQETSPP